MRSDKKIRYVKILDLYICINSNLIALTWFLLFRTRPFNLHVRAHNKYFRLLPGNFVKIIRVLNIIRIIFVSNRNNSQNKETMYVPYIGHILKKTSEGYKVFNLKEKLVACQFKNNCTDDFIRVVNELERIKILSVSPIVKWVDYENKCIYEEYVNQYRARVFYPISPYFYNKVLPVWDRVSTELPYKKTCLRKYVMDKNIFISNKIECLLKEGYGKGKEDAIKEINNFVEEITKKIMLSHQDSITLALSHGDLHAWNILLSNKRIVVIDWETFGDRSLFHDIFYMFYHNVFGKEQVNIEEFVKSLDNVLHYALFNLNKETHIKSGSKIDIELYRMLFYLEYIHLDFEKRLKTYKNKRSIQDRLRNTRKCITSFQEVEKHITGLVL